MVFSAAHMNGYKGFKNTHNSNPAIKHQTLVAAMQHFNQYTAITTDRITHQAER